MNVLKASIRQSTYDIRKRTANSTNLYSAESCQIIDKVTA